MHGRLKVKTDSQKQLEKQKEREKKANQFLEAQKLVFQMRLDGKADKEALDITGQLVAVNPDFYTIWNYRREIILNFKNKADNDVNSDEFTKICRNELQLTENCLRVNPKSYCVWHQRRWIIQNMPNPDFKTEISLCTQCLQLDERNFHCWDYRRFVSKLAKIDVSEELKFTLQKIEQNFSNFSSWYYRSCLFTSAAVNEQVDFTKEWKNEYNLVENAIFTDPSDQSAWFYHKWLVSTNYGHNMNNRTDRKNSGHVIIERLVIDLANKQLVIHTSRPLKNKPLVTVTLNDEFLSDIEWTSSGGIVSDIWFVKVSAEKFLKLSINPYPTFAPNPEYIESLNIINENCEDTQKYIWQRKTSDSDQRMALDETYLKSLRELHKLEPKNKWVNLTLAWNDPSYSKMDNILDALIELDPLRVNYYNDLKSKSVLKERIDSLQTTDFAQLNRLKLTGLYHFNRLSHIRFLDLSDNNLLKLSKAFNDLVSLEILVINSNKIYAIDKDFRLNRLKTLSISNNQISESKSLINLKNLIHLETLIIKDNPISESLRSMSNEELCLSVGTKIIIDSESNQCPDIDFSHTLQSKVNYNLF